LDEAGAKIEQPEDEDDERMVVEQQEEPFNMNELRVSMPCMQDESEEGFSYFTDLLKEQFGEGKMQVGL
jgi:hypothetical protein